MRWFLALLLLAPCATAQLTAKPESWTSLEGHYIADAEPNDAVLMWLLSRGAVNQARAAGKRFGDAEPLVELAAQTLTANNLNAAYRMWGRALAVFKDRAPGEWLEVAASLQFHLDRRIAPPGAVIHPRLSPTFVLDRPLKEVFSIRITLFDPAGKAARPPKIDKLDSLEAREYSFPTASLAPGEYSVRYELLDKDSRVLVSAARDLILDPALPGRVRSLRAQSEKIALAGAAAKGPLHALAVDTVEFIATQYDAALRGPAAGYVQNLSPLAATLAGFNKPYYSTDSIAPARDLPLAEALAEGLLAGANPLATRKGDLRLAYRSAPEQILVPFRIYLPPAYDPAKKWPLAVVLHGASGDEGSYLERYRDAAGENVTAKLAAERGYIVLAPNGRGPASFYSGAGAQDVFDVLGRVKAAWPVDEKQIFLTGHSMGAMGTISLSLDARSRFAAFAAVAGVPVTPQDYSKAPAVPFLFVQAAADVFFPTDEVRRFGFVLEKRYKLFEYVEFPGLDHVAVATVSMPKVFDFFDSIRAGAFKPSGKPVPLPSNLK